jgi:hypothetical protein
MDLDKIFGKKMSKNNKSMFGDKLSKNFGISGMKTGSGLFGNSNTSSKGASTKTQNIWANMSTPQRAIMRRTNIDSDKDGVPNKWDCQPNNRMKQDSNSDEYKQYNKYKENIPKTYLDFKVESDYNSKFKRYNVYFIDEKGRTHIIGFGDTEKLAFKNAKEKEKNLVYYGYAVETGKNGSAINYFGHYSKKDVDNNYKSFINEWLEKEKNGNAVVYNIHKTRSYPDRRSGGMSKYILYNSLYKNKNN